MAYRPAVLSRVTPGNVAAPEALAISVLKGLTGNEQAPAELAR